MITRILLITLLIICMSGAELRELADKPQNNYTNESFYNMTSKLDYDYFHDESNWTFEEDSMDRNQTHLARGIDKFIDFSIYSFIHVMKYGWEFGFENPQYNYNLGWKLLLISCFAFILIPLLYLIIFLGYGANQLYRLIKKKVKKEDG